MDVIYSLITAFGRLLAFIFKRALIMSNPQNAPESPQTPSPSVQPLMTPTAPTEPSSPQIEAPTATHTSRIVPWANAIKQWEGADPALNNPGNLKYASLTASWGGMEGKQASDGGWLCKFATYEQGFQALCNFLTLGAEDELIAFHDARTFEAFTKVYAGNPPQGYINGVAELVGIALDADVSTLL